MSGAVTQAALALINAYGGDVPPWLRDEVAALVEAIDKENANQLFTDISLVTKHPPCKILAPGTTAPRTFTFRFSREVTETEYVMREIEAPNIITAQGLANAMASEFNSSCPDDIEESGGADFGDWQADLES